MQLLERKYQSENFEFLVMYGRRRVGKTSILREFAKKHKAIFFSAQEKNDVLNREDFSKLVQNYFQENYLGIFADWETAFRYVGAKAENEKVVLIIDEFPFLAGEYPTIKSILQHIIDHDWSKKNIFLILCGSSVSFMENEVMGYQSPLYGRSTARLEVEAFDYLKSGEFFPKYTCEEKLLAYGILGGIPCYLQTFHDDKSIQENVVEQILTTGAFLKDEPQLLLKMELREPAIYNSIFEAIASGCTHMNEIANRINEASGKCSKYISTLRTLRLIDKITPCGEKESTKKSIYKISDNFYSFWYRFMFANKSYYELLGEESAAQEIMEEISQYMGTIFEEICLQYMKRLAKENKLPFIPYDIGRWWGNNPKKRKQDDIDILALDKQGQKAIFCECKFTKKPFDLNEYEDLFAASHIFKDVKQRYYYIFSKSGYTKAVEEVAKENSVKLLKIEDLFQ